MFTKDDLILGGLGAVGVLSLIGASYYVTVQTQKAAIQAQKDEIANLARDNEMLAALKEVSPYDFGRAESMVKEAQRSPILRQYMVGNIDRLVIEFVMKERRSAASASDAALVRVAKAQAVFFSRGKALGALGCFSVVTGRRQDLNPAGSSNAAVLDGSRQLNTAILKAIAEGKKRPLLPVIYGDRLLQLGTYENLLATMKKKGATQSHINLALNATSSNGSNYGEICDANIILAQALTEMPAHQTAEYFRLTFRSAAIDEANSPAPYDPYGAPAPSLPPPPPSDNYSTDPGAPSAPPVPPPPPPRPSTESNSIPVPPPPPPPPSPWPSR